MKTKTETYSRVSDASGEIYYCPVDGGNESETAAVVDFDECVGKDVVGRYAGNIDIH